VPCIFTPEDEAPKHRYLEIYASMASHYVIENSRLSLNQKDLLDSLHQGMRLITPNRKSKFHKKDASYSVPIL
jgi:hypothetical protein